MVKFYINNDEQSIEFLAKAWIDLKLSNFNLNRRMISLLEAKKETSYSLTHRTIKMLSLQSFTHIYMAMSIA